MGYSRSREIRRWEMRKMKAAGLSVEEAYSDEEGGLVPDLVYKESSSDFLGNKVFDPVLRNKIEIEKPGTEISAVAKRGSVFLSVHPRSYVAPSASGEVDREVSQRLPIESFRDDLMEFVGKHRVIVLVGETGSGKSTQVPKYLYQEGYGDKGIIGCTQPRRAAAISLASTLKREMGCAVGYSIRFDSTTTQDTKIRYMTEGILLQELLADKMLRRYSVVILDEAHERTTNLDISMGLLKLALKERDDLRIIIMSATIEAQKLCNYFGCPAFNIEGRSYPVETRYLSVNVDDYVEWTVKKILYIHENCGEGDILVFVTGRDDVEGVVGIVNHCIRNKCFGEGSEGGRGLKVLPFYSQLPEEMQNRVFQAEKDVRKCVVSTNVAETSLTIPNIGYVIDTGLQKISVYSYDTGESLVTVPISRANADQRTGRAGRTRPGVCYRMYTADTYENDMLPSPVPEIQRTNIHNIVLLLLKHGVHDILGFDFVDRPSEELIQGALLGLHRLGAVCSRGLLTKVGKEMSELRLDPPLARMVLGAAGYGAVNEIASIASMLSVHEVFHRDFDKSSPLCHQGCDFLTLLNIFNAFIRQKNRSEWCNKMKVSEHALKRATETKRAVLMSLREMGVPISSTRSLDKIQRCIISSVHYNVARRRGKGYVCLSNFRACMVHPSSVLADSYSQYIIFYKHLSTRAEYMYCCSDISPQMILEEAGCYYRDRNGVFNIQKHPVIEDGLDREHNLFGPACSLTGARVPGKIALDENLYDRFEKWNESEESDEEPPKKIRRTRI
uniref:Pre-mRNA splicing factor n=1 Tax=Encephalitozoon cuniculi TaxID=6035 RepID=M1KAG5_ENCCN|nr:pre-mRNA splicing factor [Encephalitozoon cuniculi]